MKRAVGLLPALAALLLAACGGGAGGGSDDARTLIQQTFANPKEIRSGNVRLSVGIRTQGSGQLDSNPIDLRFDGPFERTGKRSVPRFAFTLTAGAGGGSFSAGATSTGTAGFLSLQGRDYALPAAQYTAFRRSFAKVARAATSPGKAAKLPWLSDARVAGEEDVTGTPSEHVTGKVDLGKVVDSIEKNRRGGSPGFSPTQRKQVLDAVRDPTFEFWTGKDDHLLRRVKVSFRFAVPAAKQAQLAGVRSADISVDYQLSALNEAQQIPTPASPRPISELSAQLQSYAQTLRGLLGGLGQTGSGGSSTPPPPASGQSRQVQKYAQCLQAAGNDVAKKQRCAALLPH